LAFGRVVLLTDRPLADLDGDASGIDVVTGITVATREDYSRFVVTGLREHLTTPFVLLVQWDGFVVNPAAWSDAFLDFDYIGARWHWHRDGMDVGNGGFSLRSRRLLDALADPAIVVDANEDEVICRKYRPFLEQRYGIRFAPASLADRFSFEADYAAGTPFGFHGLFNFWRVLSPAELAEFCSDAPDAIALSPQFGQLCRNYMNLGRWSEAATCLERAVAADPGRTDLAEALAHCRASAARTPAARRNDPCPCGSGRRYKHCHGSGSGSDAVAAADADAETRLRSALALHQRGDVDAAERAYRELLAHVPGHPIAEHFLGVARYQRGDFTEALPLLQRSTAARPQEPDFHLNLGLALLATGEEDGAIAEIGETLRLNPRHPAAHNNLGLALQARNRLPEAIAAFRAAVALQPSYAEAHWNLSLALLAAGEFAEGWREYEWRLRVPALGGVERPSPLPRWDGRIAPGRRLRLTTEQGFGDAIQFARFVPMLARAGMRIELQCRPELHRLFRSLEGVERLLAPDDHTGTAECVHHLMSVPAVLGLDAASLPESVPYLGVARADVDAWRARTRALGEVLKVGVVWAGRKTHTNDRNRSLPFEALAPLVDLDGIRLVSLQQGDVPEAFARLATSGRIASYASVITDFYDTAALIEALDVVVTVDTSVAHLAGALARPVIVMLPFAPDWRWMLGRTDSAWYPTATLVRQATARDWAPVVAEVRQLLAARARSPGGGAPSG
jgi:tetratricopeptide (TPR) repeat protein